MVYGVDVVSCLCCAIALTVCFAAIGLGGQNINRKWHSPETALPVYKLAPNILQYKKESKGPNEQTSWFLLSTSQYLKNFKIGRPWGSISYATVGND